MPSITRGKAGQTSRHFLAGVLGVQTNRRLRRLDDPKTRHRHRLHTCTSVCHASMSPFSPYISTALISNIASRTLSGSTSIGVTWSTWIRVGQHLFHNETYLNLALFTHSNNNNFLPPAKTRTTIYWNRWPGRGDRAAGVSCGDLMRGSLELSRRAIWDMLMYLWSKWIFLDIRY
jgi:hypothetical protein